MIKLLKKTGYYNLKKLDRSLLNMFFLSAFILIFIFIYDDYKSFLRTTSLVIGFIYFFFIMLHLALCFPLIMIGFLSGSFLYNTSIKDKSEILYILLSTIIFLSICFVIYLLIPILLVMMYNGNLDFYLAYNDFKVILNK